jgi:spermidine synthase
LGIRTSYFLTIALNALIATISFLLSRASKYEIPQIPSKGELRKEKLSQRKSWDFRKVSLLALLSGFITLSLEVLWTRMFAQVFMNDVYSFATILVTFLLSLAIGSFLARYLMIKEVNRIKTLRTLLILSGVLVGISPLLFSYWTDGLAALPVSVGWGGYILSLLRMSAVVTLLPTILMGSIFPYLLQIAPTFRYGIGETIGYLTAINTLGSIFGSLFAGFLFMKILGLWYSVALMAALYFLLSLLTIERPTLGKFGQYAGFAAALTLAFAFLPASGLSSVRLNLENAEELLDLRFGRDGIVSVISAQPSYYPEDFQDLFIRLNNTYTLGGVGSAPDEKRQSHLSLFLHPNPQSVYILGLATGISAGGALHHPVSRVVVSELVPEVVDVAESYFEPYNNGLFQDTRVQIVVDDGRNFLLGTDERFDVIIADLFEPWGAGTGDLYSLEHFQSVQAHLHEGGIFVQWLPLHQISLQEFGIIARTITEVFPQVTLWRGNFVPNKPIAALVASNEIKPLDWEAMLANVQALGENPSTLIDALVSVKGYPTLELDPDSEEFILQILPQLTESVPFTFYAGNIGHNKNLFDQYPLNSDDRPMFEFLAPKTRGNQPENRNSWLTSTNLSQLFEQLFGALPPKNDPYLTKLSTTQINYIQAGLSYYKALTYSYEGQITGSTELIKDSQFLMDDYLERMNLADPDDPR